MEVPSREAARVADQIREQFPSGEILAAIIDTALEKLRIQNEMLQKKIQLLHHATIVLRSGMGGHRHFDYHMESGAGTGCRICNQQRDARRVADALISEAGIGIADTEITRG